jgi:peptide/nickel transport system substrate-binding protein
MRQAATSRRRLLRGAALGGAGLAAATMLGCATGNQSGGTSTTGATASKEPKRGGVITHAGGSAGTYDTRGTGLDPQVQEQNGAMTLRLIYNGLLAYDLKTYEVIPDLAAKWEQRSETEFVFHLQPGVKWHNKPPANGRELTADDVVYSLDRARTNDPRFINRSLLANMDKAEAVDKSTVKITAKRPDATLLSMLSGDAMMMVAPEVVERAGKFATPETAVGTGPFIMKSLVENASSEYVRNPDFWKPGRPYLDAVQVRHFNDEATAYAAFLAGQIDIARVPGKDSKDYVAKQGKDYKPLWYADQGGLIAYPNLRVKPLDDLRVVRALRLMIDHQEMITAWAEVWHGRGRHGSIFPPAIDFWDFTHEEYEKFLEWQPNKDAAVQEANSLLSAAGFTPSNPARFELGSQDSDFVVALTQTVQGQWKKFSRGAVDTQIKIWDLPTSASVRSNRTFEFFVGGGLSAGAIEPDSYLKQIYRTGGSRNYTSFSDPKLDEMIDKQGAIFNLEQRKAAIKEIILYMIDHGVSTIPANRYFLLGAKPHIRELSPEFFLLGRQYEYVWLDT